MGRLRVGEHEDGSNFSPFSKLVMVPTLDFVPRGILLGVMFVPPAAGWSTSEIFSEGFHLWTRFGPPVFCHVFTIFFWKLGVGAVSDNVSQSCNYSVGPFF